MDTAELFFFFFITTSCALTIVKHPSVSAQSSLCDSSWSCASTGPTIQSPFWVYKQQSKTCGPQGFALLCNNKSQTILSLPFSGEFTVKYIDYDSSIIFINDPDSCLPNRIQNLSLFSSPFRPLFSRTNYKFVNCSSNVTDFIAGNVRTHAVKFSCLSGKNHSVYAVSSLLSDQELPSSCVKISSNSSNSQKWVESQWWSFMTERGDLRLRWVDTRCLPCAAQGLACGVTDNANEMGCISSSSKQGLPRGAKYGIIVGVAIPALVFLIGLACYLCGWIRVYSSRRRSVANFSATISPQSFPNITTGLDGMIIESYPKTVVGESRRLPKPNEPTCSICLCEYQPQEALRTLPGCNHFFHCGCIDEWLKLNGSCPLCRTSPESILITPRPSVSSPTTTTPP